MQFCALMTFDNPDTINLAQLQKDIFTSSILDNQKSVGFRKEPSASIRQLAVDISSVGSTSINVVEPSHLKSTIIKSFIEIAQGNPLL
jgi:hypothetical protein